MTTKFEPGTHRVSCGGSWNFLAQSAHAARGSLVVTSSWYDDLGLRLVRRCP